MAHPLLISEEKKGGGDALTQRKALPVSSRMPQLDALLKQMVDLGSSDMHLGVGSPPNIRLKGELRPMGAQGLDEATVRGMLYEILSKTQIAEFEKNLDLDFGHAAPGIARFRGNIFMKSTGIAAVFRQIPYDILSMAKLGLPPVVEQMCEFKNGLVLVTGPTGSGKSTTLASMIDHINAKSDEHIITLEDPIEFVHPKKKCLISQREIGAHCLSFANGLRAALREDPDVIMVGEMRDLETIQLAMTAAETGHLVFGTLHTRNASKTVDRIIDVFPQERQSQVRTMLSESLRGVISQTLLKRADGKSRIGAYEILIATTGIRALIREGKTFQIASSIATGKKEGMQTLDQHLWDLFQKGLISPEEAIKSCDNPAPFQRFANQKPVAVAA
jgi:twitching motility protein PilT